MNSVSQKELNQYIKNMYKDIELPQLQAAHAGNVRKFLEENLSNIGRYGHRDFERFGNLEHQHTADYQQKRQDGWYSLTKEVPNIDHLTYGTGMLYIHGPMEIPLYEDNSKECMKQDDFYHISKGGKQYFKAQCEQYDTWTEVTDGGPMLGYQWELMPNTETGDDAGSWCWKTIMQSVGGEDPDEADKNGLAVSVEKEMPPKFNDEDIYNVESERDHFPFVIVNSGQAKSVETLLKETLQDNNGMYDEEIPELAKGNGYPPADGGISYNGGTKPIVDFISPLESK